jgi:hypothetical protein
MVHFAWYRAFDIRTIQKPDFLVRISHTQNFSFYTKRSRLAAILILPFENRTNLSSFRMVKYKMAAKTIRKPDLKIVRKIPDSPVFGGSLYKSTIFIHQH